MDPTQIQGAFEKVWETWLKTVDDSVGTLTKSPAYLQGMGRFMEGAFGARALWNQAIEKGLAEARLASKDDVEKLGVQLHAIEAKLNEVLLRQDEERAVCARQAAAASRREAAEAPEIPGEPAKKPPRKR